MYFLLMTLQFSESDLSLLKELQRNTSDRDTYQKLTTLIMLYNKLSQEFIAEMLGVDRTTVNRHFPFCAYPYCLLHLLRL